MLSMSRRLQGTLTMFLTVTVTSCFTRLNVTFFINRQTQTQRDTSETERCSMWLWHFAMLKNANSATYAAGTTRVNSTSPRCRLFSSHASQLASASNSRLMPSQLSCLLPPSLSLSLSASLSVYVCLYANRDAALLDHTKGARDNLSVCWSRVQMQWSLATLPTPARPSAQ